MRLGKIKCAAKVGRLMGGFAALFILRRDSQTALPKIALSVGFCLAVRVALSDRVADNGGVQGECDIGATITFTLMRKYLEEHTFPN